MRGHRRTALVVVAVAALAVWGCSNPLNEAGPPLDESVTSSGLDTCYGEGKNCHNSGGMGSEPFLEWSQSVHANTGAFPSMTYFNHAPVSDCTVCHDRTGDGGNLGSFTGPGSASTPRPVVGCEGCHDEGAEHFAAAMGMEVVAGPEACGKCHNSEYHEQEGSAEGEGIIEDYRTSPHLRSINPGIYLDGGKTQARPTCSKCHSDEGARLFAGLAADEYPGSAATIVEYPTPVQCRTCHDAHNPTELLKEADAIGSDEFNTCTGCHQLVDDGGDLLAGYHFTEKDWIITDTHFAVSGSFTGTYSGGRWSTNANRNAISGYAMAFTDERVCRNCHNVHGSDVTINMQWAGSKHADTTAAGAWAHYNWTEIKGRTRNDGSPTDDRRACQRCHTTTGLIAFLEDDAPNDTSYYPGLLPFNPNYKPEMLHCNGCHEDSAGGLRDPGPLLVNYDFVSSAGTVVLSNSFQYDDAKGSGVCMACHTGRQNGETIKGLYTRSGVAISFTNLSFINPHYLGAGGTLFLGTGYEYSFTSTNVYSNHSFFAHDQIGIGDTVGIGTAGPCVGCHLTGEETHRYHPVENSAAGSITRILSEACAQCHRATSHGDFTLTPADLEEEKERFEDALEALKEKLAVNKIFYSPSYPYFYNTSNFGGRTTYKTNWLLAGDTDRTGDATGKNNMGAAFNFALLEHEPGAWAHNSLYVKLLMFDSLNWLEATKAVTDSPPYSLPVPDGTIDLADHPLAASYFDGNEDPDDDDQVHRPFIVP